MVTGMVPRWTLALAVVVVLAVLAFDVGGQAWIEGHTANPLIVGGSFTFLGALFAAARGPKPPADDADEPADDDQYRPRHAGRGR